MELVVESYRLTRELPRAEVYGLTAQLRRSAVSVPANIAEGNGRNQLGDYLRYLSIAHGSLMELETHIVLATQLGFFSASDQEGLLGRTREVGMMLRRLVASLRSRLPGAVRSSRAMTTASRCDPILGARCPMPVI